MQKETVNAPIGVRMTPVDNHALLAELAPFIFTLTGERAKHTTAPAVDLRICLPPSAAFASEGFRTEAPKPVVVLAPVDADAKGGALSAAKRIVGVPQILIHPNVVSDPYLTAEAIYIAAASIYAPPTSTTNKSGKASIRTKGARYNEVAEALDLVTKGQPFPILGGFAKRAVASIVDTFLRDNGGRDRWDRDMAAFAIFKTTEESKGAFEDTLVCETDLAGGKDGSPRKRDERHVYVKTPKARTAAILGGGWTCLSAGCGGALVVLPPKAKAAAKTDPGTVEVPTGEVETA